MSEGGNGFGGPPKIIPVKAAGAKHTNWTSLGGSRRGAKIQSASGSRQKKENKKKGWSRKNHQKKTKNGVVKNV